MGKSLPSAKDLKAILFDVDGTITDSDPLHFQAFQEIFQQAGFQGGAPMTKDYFLKQISGKLNTVIAFESFPELSEDERQKVTDNKEARFRSLAKDHTKPIPGLMKFVDWIKERGFRRAAVSNSPRDNVEQVIEALGLTNFFEIIVIGNECEHPKPYPDPYLKALQHLGVTPETTIIFEDSPAGLRAGVAAEVSVVGLTTGHRKDDLLAAGASLIIEDYSDPALWEHLEPKSG
ncbi:unnamed protein product [Calypogeia fissa]